VLVSSRNSEAGAHVRLNCENVPRQEHPVSNQTLSDTEIGEKGFKSQNLVSATYNFKNSTSFAVFGCGRSVGYVHDVVCHAVKVRDPVGITPCHYIFR